MMLRSLLTGRFIGARKARKSSLKRRLFLQILVGAAFAAFGIQSANAQSYTSTSATGLWNTSRWNNSADAAPYTSAWAANSNASFTSGTYSFAGGNASGAVNVGNITLASGVTVNFTAASGTIATSATRAIDVGSGAFLDFNAQAMSTAAGTGFIKNGAGVLATAGGGYSGGFTLNAGTVIMRGVDAMGGSATNVLTLNGGTVASNANRSMANTKYGGGIVIGGNVQFGELATVVSLASSSTNLSFANNVSLGAATRTLTHGNNGTNTFSGIISNTSGGITFAANSNTDGRFEITNTGNTFTGDININGGEVRFGADGSFGNAANDIVIDGGRLATVSATTYTLGAGRDISVGDGAGTSISVVTSGTLTYNNAILNKAGETGSWAKQGGGTLALGGVSTYTGTTAINSGTLQLTTGNDRLPTGTVVSLGQAASTNVGTFDLNGRSQQIAGLNTVTGSGAAANTVTSTGGATLTIGGSGTYSYGSSSAANNGTITGAITLTKTGSGTQTLGQSNSYTGGTNITGGTLSFANGALGTTGNITVNGGSLQWNGTNTQDISSRLVLQNSGSAVLDTNGNNITLASGFGSSASSSLTKAGAGTLTLSGANNYSGGTTINGGTLALSGSGTLGSTTGALAVNSNGTLNLGTTSQTVGAVNLGGGTISNGLLTASTFTSTGGTISAGATLNSAGAINMSSGVTTVNGNLGGTGLLTVANDATLKGTGTIGNSTIVNGILNSGNSTGTLTFTNSLTLGGSSTTNIEISGNGVGQFDVLRGNSNTLIVGGVLALDNSGYVATAGDTVTIFSNWSGITGTFSSITGTDLGGGLSWDTSSLYTSGSLTVTAVPEPTSMVLVGLVGVAGVAIRARRRKTKNA